MRKGDLLPDFISAIRAGREPEVNAIDVFRVMDICFAAPHGTQNAVSICSLRTG